MINKLHSIPVIFKGIMTGFLTILMIYVTYPITDYLLALFTAGSMMAYASVIVYYLVILFVTWFLLWVMLFKAPEGGSN